MSSHLKPDFRALNTSYSLDASIFTPFLLNIFNILTLEFAFIAYLVVCQKAEGKLLKSSTDLSNSLSL